MTPSAVLLSDDLIFTSRIVGTGRDLGLPIQCARTAEAALALSAQRSPTCVIIDLSNPSLKISEMLAGLATLSIRPRVVAYGSHVDTATLQAARAAGCDDFVAKPKIKQYVP